MEIMLNSRNKFVPESSASFYCHYSVPKINAHEKIQYIPAFIIIQMSISDIYILFRNFITYFKINRTDIFDQNMIVEFCFAEVKIVSPLQVSFFCHSDKIQILKLYNVILTENIYSIWSNRYSHCIVVRFPNSNHVLFVGHAFTSEESLMIILSSLLCSLLFTFCQKHCRYVSNFVS